MTWCDRAIFCSKIGIWAAIRCRICSTGQSRAAKRSRWAATEQAAQTIVSKWVSRLGLEQERNDYQRPPEYFLPLPNLNLGQLPAFSYRRMKNGLQLFSARRDLRKTIRANFVGAANPRRESIYLCRRPILDFAQCRPGRAGPSHDAITVRINNPHTRFAKKTGGCGFSHSNAAGKSANFH